MTAVNRGHELQGPDILGEARSAKTQAGVQEAAPNAGVQAHSLRHLSDIGSQLLANGGHLVDKRDLGRQESVRRVLDHLSGPNIGQHDGSVERAIEVRHGLGR